VPIDTFRDFMLKLRDLLMETGEIVLDIYCTSTICYCSSRGPSPILHGQKISFQL